MKNLLIFITFALFAFPFYIPLTEGMDLQIKGQGKRSIHKTKYLPKGVNIDQARPNKDFLEDKSYEQIPVISESMIKDLSVKARSNFYSKLDGKAQDPLILFLNSNGSLPEGVGANYSDLSNKDLSTDILALIGLSKNSGDSLSVIQVVSKIGLTAALWGNPIVGAVSTVVMSLAFNQFRNNDQYIYKQRKKEEDKIYYDIYKDSSYDETANSLLNGAGLNIEDIDRMNLSQTELKNKVSMAIISQRSLMMLASRLAGADVKSSLGQGNILPVNNTTPVQSPLITRCFQYDLSIGKSNGFFVK